MFVRSVLPALLFCLSLPAAAAAPPALEEALIAAAPSADPQVVRLALAAAACASRSGEPARRLAVIDYSRPSTEPRLWVFDLAKATLLHTELVAHGRNSGDNFARSFSNVVNSRASSLGLFRTRSTYRGKHGYSLRLDGLEPGFNDRAAERAIVMHGAPYVSTEFSRSNGRLGRSHGCPAVRDEIARPLIDLMKDGQYVFSYYPDPQWLAASRFLNCGAPPPAPATPAGTVAAGSP